MAVTFTQLTGHCETTKHVLWSQTDGSNGDTPSHRTLPDRQTRPEVTDKWQ